MNTQSPTTQCVLDHNENGYALRITLEKSGLECYAAVETRSDRELLTFSVLRAFLNQFNVIRPDTEAMATFIQKVKEANGPVAKTLIAKGTEPTQGEDAYFDLSFQPATPGYLTADIFDRVDQRSVQAFDNVEAGDLLGRLHPPEVGDDGATADGKVIPGISGKNLSFHAGKGVRLDEKSGEFFAEIQGRVVQSERSIEVTEDYEVLGNVDFRVGHIHFNGKVKINGSVLDGFNVRATDDITIGGDVGRSQIESDGDITLHCMAGQGGGQIRCGGTLTADTLIDTEVECIGDVVVRSEIRNCIIRTRGQILIAGGQIHGGDCISLGGIECRVAGCESGLATRLAAGFDYQIEEQKRQRWAELAECDRQLASVSRVITTLRKRLQPGEPEPKNLSQLITRQEDLLSTKHRLSDELDTFSRKTLEGGNGKINIEEVLYEGTTLALGAVETLIQSNRKDALTIIENIDGETLKSLPLSPLEITADQIRDEYVLD